MCVKHKCPCRPVHTKSNKMPGYNFSKSVTILAKALGLVLLWKKYLGLQETDLDHGGGLDFGYERAAGVPGFIHTVKLKNRPIFVFFPYRKYTIFQILPFHILFRWKRYPIDILLMWKWYPFIYSEAWVLQSVQNFINIHPEVPWKRLNIYFLMCSPFIMCMKSLNAYFF